MKNITKANLLQNFFIDKPAVRQNEVLSNKGKFVDKKKSKACFSIANI